MLRLRKPSRRLVLTDPPYFMWMYDRLVGQLIAANCFSKSASSPIHALNGNLSSPVDNYSWKHAVESLRLRLIPSIWWLGTLQDDYAGQVRNEPGTKNGDRSPYSIYHQSRRRDVC